MPRAVSARQRSEGLWPAAICFRQNLAWISTGPDLPNMVLGQTAHFRALSLRNYYAKWCADSPIAQRLLAQRSRDSGQFRSLLDEEMLGAGLHQRTNWPTSYSKILESRESVSV